MPEERVPQLRWNICIFVLNKHLSKLIMWNIIGLQIVTIWLFSYKIFIEVTPKYWSLLWLWRYYSFFLLTFLLPHIWMFALRITDTIFNCNCVSTLSSVSSQLPSAIAHLSFVSSLAFSLLSTIIRRHRLYTLAYDTSTTSVTASFSAAVNNNIASRYFRFFIVRLFWFLLPLFHFLSSSTSIFARLLQRMLFAVYLSGIAC